MTINLVPRPPAQTLSRSRGEKATFLHSCEIKSAWVRGWHVIICRALQSKWNVPTEATVVTNYAMAASSNESAKEGKPPAQTRKQVSFAVTVKTGLEEMEAVQQALKLAGVRVLLNMLGLEWRLCREWYRMETAGSGIDCGLCREWYRMETVQGVV